MNITVTAHESRTAPGTASHRDRLRSLYAEVDAAVAALGPACGLSGRCCRFHEAGHTLFLSAPEAGLLLAEAPPPARPLDTGATCPWQSATGLCTAREARPLGCRVYFCDPGYQRHAPELSETYIARLKQIVAEAGLPWEYAPLHQHLRRALTVGRFPPPSRCGPASPRAG
jgi:Fe-S-cluster containining protein